MDFQKGRGEFIFNHANVMTCDLCFLSMKMRHISGCSCHMRLRCSICYFHYYLFRNCMCPQMYDLSLSQYYVFTQIILHFT